MKTAYWIGCLLILSLVSCKKENRWVNEKPESTVELKFTDISKDFFNTQISIQEIRAKYPFFFDNRPDEIWEKQRKDSLETAVYDSVNKVFGNGEYKSELEKMFSYFKKYYPEIKLPEVYTYASGLQNIYEDAILYGKDEAMLFIALDGFMGSDNYWYKSENVYPYMAERMNPQNLTPAVVHAIGEQVTPFNPRQQAFIDLMIDEGKMLILADALIPETPDEFKIGYTKEQLDWATANEEEIWNYFVEQNLIFSADRSNGERFLKPAPYSKFGNEIETESPGRIGVWVGWQICRKYLDEHPKTGLKDFLSLENQTIFKDSKYKPTK